MAFLRQRRHCLRGGAQELAQGSHLHLHQQVNEQIVISHASFHLKHITFDTSEALHEQIF